MHAKVVVPGRRYARLATLGAVLVALACNDHPPTTPWASPYPTGAQAVARALAAGLADDGARHAVRDAMRASPFDGHKISLRQFLESAEGQPLLRSASGFEGKTTDEFLRDVQAMGPMDFYMPVRDHRRTWRGDAHVAVIAAAEGGDSLPAYLPDGTVLRASKKSAAGLPPFFFLEPAEPKGLRVGAQAAIPGVVIEEPNDGKGSEVFVFRTPNGDSTVIDVALLPPEQRGVLYAGGPDTTLVGHFEHYNCDNGYCWTDAEFRFETTYYSANGAVLGTGEYRRGSLEPGVQYLLNAPIIFKRMLNGSSESMYIHLIEEDRGDPFGFNKDDNCGAVTIGPGQNGGWQVYYNVSGCEGGVDEGWLFGYVAEAEYKWTPRTSDPPPPPPPGYTVSIVGPRDMEPGQTCNWYASHNVPNPSYEWYVNEGLVGTGQEIYYSSSSSFTLRVQVYDGQGGGQGTSISVNVASGTACAIE